MLGHLAERELTIGELATPFSMSFAGASKHVRVLEGTGLVRSRKLGRIRTCVLDRENLAAAERWFEEQRATWASRYRNLDNLLEELKGKEDES